jgi:glycosyltransferase involved in cell wall biosynthesis
LNQRALIGSTLPVLSCLASSFELQAVCRFIAGQQEIHRSQIRAFAGTGFGFENVKTVNKGTAGIETHIVLAGHFDPSTIGPMIGGEAGKALAGLSGAPGVPIHHLASEFARRGIQTTVIGGIIGAREVYAQSSPLSAIVYPKRGRIAWIADGYGQERRLIDRYLRKIHPTIVHAHWTMEAARAVADWDGPKVLTVHDAAWEWARLGWSWRWGPLAHVATLRWLANTSAVLARFQHVIAVSPYVESYLRQKHGFRGEIRVIPNGIPPLPASVEVKNTFPKTGHVTFGCYGHPWPLKNLPAGIRAFLRVHEELPNSRLVVYGTGWERERGRYVNLPIEFRGAKPHLKFLQELGSEIDIWVHPSRTEAHPISICEAIQAGCPVIAGRSSGAVPWTLDNGRAGVLVDVEDPVEIAQAMLGLVHDRERALELVAYGRDMILKKWSPDRIVEMHLEYYKEIAGSW